MSVTTLQGKRIGQQRKTNSLFLFACLPVNFVGFGFILAVFVLLFFVMFSFGDCLREREKEGKTHIQRERERERERERGHFRLVLTL
jgi:Na+-transporting methylmalonyl-CoA/oxaloacetate decarboxylase gamma subunit